MNKYILTTHLLVWWCFGSGGEEHAFEQYVPCPILYLPDSNLFPNLASEKWEGTL